MKTAPGHPRVLIVGCGGIGGVVAAGLAGAGVDPCVVTRSGADEFHASARSGRASLMRHRNDALPGLSPDWHETDPARVRALAAVLRDAR